jgi:hypothetical protein
MATGGNRKRTESQGPRGRFVTLNALADRWACDRKTVRRNLEADGVPAYFLGRGKRGIVRYDLRDVEEYEQRHRGP